MCKLQRVPVILQGFQSEAKHFSLCVIWHPSTSVMMMGSNKTGKFSEGPSLTASTLSFTVIQSVIRSLDWGTEEIYRGNLPFSGFLWTKELQSGLNMSDWKLFHSSQFTDVLELKVTAIHKPNLVKKELLPTPSPFSLSWLEDNHANNHYCSASFRMGLKVRGRWWPAGCQLNPRLTLNLGGRRRMEVGGQGRFLSHQGQVCLPY